MNAIFDRDCESIWDEVEAQRLKHRGKTFAALNRADALAAAKLAAYDLAFDKGEVTADDVYQALDLLDQEALGNAAGSVFKGKDWIWTGEWRASTRVSNHGRFLRVWRLRRAGE